MGWDGAGGYSRQHNFSADASAGIKILAARMDAEIDDIASAIPIAWARDGQNVPTTDMPMGGRKFVNVGAPTSVANYLRVREFIENVPIFMQDAESSADRISVSSQYFTSVSAAQAPVDGTKIIVRAGSNKSSAVMYLDGHSANVEYQDGNRIGAALVSGGIYELTFSSVDAAWKVANPDDGRTAAEIAAGVTPTNYQYEPGDVRRYGAILDGTTDDAAALQNAINANSEVFGIVGTLAIGSQVELKSDLTIRGNGYTISKIKATANNYSLLSDNDVSLSNVVISDLGFEAASVGSSNRGLLFDADTANVSTNILIDRCRFTTLFRAIEVDRAAGLKIRDCIFQSLGGVGVYVGDNAGAGRSEKVSITGCTFADNGGVDIEGGAVVSYADEVDVSDNHVENVGGQGGSTFTTLYHGIYLRCCTHAAIADNTLKTLLRGAGIHVYADVGGGEATNKHITITGNVITDAQHYNGIRCDQVEGLTITGNTVKDSYTNAMYLTDISGLAVTGNVLHNNNSEELGSMQGSAAIRLQDIIDFAITGNVARETEASGAEYGQGGFVRFEGVSTDGTISGNTFSFSGDTTNGYYFCETSGTIDRVTFTGNVQRGASAFLNEGGAATDCSFFCNVISGNSGAFLTVAQYHKFSARGNFNQGAPDVYESDGTYVTARLAAIPGASTWVAGDRVLYTAPAAGADYGAVCTAGGTPGTWNAFANIDA